MRLIRSLSGYSLLACSLLLLSAGCDAGGAGNTSIDGGGADGGGGGGGDMTSSGPGPCTINARTCADVTATFDSNSMNVKVTCDAVAGTFTIVSSGIPNYTSNQTTPNAIGNQMWEVELPLKPECAGTPTDVVSSRGPVGFMINGVPFYGPQDANGNDAVTNEGPSFDDCDGHADPQCSYHYHEEPVCVFGKGDTAAQHKLPDGHSAVIGYALDGIALYASPAGGSLDKCNGHTDAIRGYHYHATPTTPYLIGCWTGKKSSGAMKHTPSCLP